MKADPAILARLDAPTLAPCWPVGVEGNSPLLCIITLFIQFSLNIHLL